MSSVQDRRKGAIQTRHRPSVPGAPFVPELEKAAAGGVATLGETNALVPDTQLATGAAAAGKALMGDRTWGDISTQAELDAEIAARIADVDAEEAARIAADAAHVAAADPHIQYQRESERGAASGYASLDGSATVPVAQIPVGATGATVCVGNDARLSDTRTPTDNTVATIKLQADAVTYPKIQNVSATDKVLGRSTVGAGDIEEIACTAAARSILDDATVADIATTLGLGTGSIAQFLALILGPLAVAQYTSRTSGGFNLANNASTAWPACEAGIGFLYDTNNSGAALVVWYDGGAAAIVWQNAAIFSTVTGTAGKLNFTYTAGAPTLENKRGATAAIRGFMWRVA